MQDNHALFARYSPRHLLEAQNSKNIPPILSKFTKLLIIVIVIVTHSFISVPWLS